MKYTWRLHPEEFSLGDTEQFYADMAKKGLRLVKRGIYFSKFEKTEPMDRIYRIELAMPGFLDEPDLPEEQVAFYEESGWQLAARSGLVHIFEAPAGTAVMELYSDPREQLPAMKKYRNRHIWSTLGVFAWLAFLVLIGRSMGGMDGDLLGELMKNWAKATSHYLGLGLLFIDGVIALIWGFIRVTAMTARAKQGKPLDRRPHLLSRLYRGFSRTVLVCVAVCFLLTLAELASVDKYDMPAVSDGPWITLSELGYTGERTTVYSSSRTSVVERGRSLLCDIWDTYEAVKLEHSDGNVWMYQEVYQLRSGGDASWIVRGMKADATMADPDAFHKIVVPGLDEAWAAGMECVARVDDTVWYITSLGSTAHEEGREYQIRILEYLGQRFGQ